MNKFFAYITNLIQNESSLENEWNERKSEITFKKNASNGFDVTVRHEDNVFLIETDKGYHDHFHIEDFESFESGLETVMGLARDLLSKNMRIKEIRSSNKPCRWFLQHFHNNKWKTESSSGLLLWNFLGEKMKYFTQMTY